MPEGIVESFKTINVKDRYSTVFIG